MKILGLSVKNVKRIKAVEITPEGAVVVLGGRNGQGKSSVLDAIAYALGGKDVLCKEPVRRGETNAEVSCDLGEYTVRRTFTAEGGGNLTLTTKDGARFSSPQKRLDDIVGQLSFDPLAFSRMDARAQAETLRALVGLDFTKTDQRRGAIFEQRTDVNRQAKAIRARLEAMPAHHEGAPADEVPSSDLLAELDGAIAANRVRDEANQDRVLKTRRLEEMAERMRRTKHEIEQLQARLISEERAWQEALEGVERATEAVAAMCVIDTDPIRARLAQLETDNRIARENQLRIVTTAALDNLNKEAGALSESLDQIERAKRLAIQGVAFPVPGLGLDDLGQVTFNGLPFEQASSAEQLRVSVGIGLALNPKLRVLLIRDGSLLDPESLRLVAEMAEGADAQLWIERVEEDGSTVVIEDGGVRGAEAVAAEGGAA